MFIKKNNIFDGVGSRSRYAKLIYSRLITREWICYADILAEDEGAKSEDYLYKRSYVRTYNELKKAFMDVRKAIGPDMGRRTKRFFNSEGENGGSCLFIGSYGRMTETA